MDFDGTAFDAWITRGDLDDADECRACGELYIPRYNRDGARVELCEACTPVCPTCGRPCAEHGAGPRDPGR